MQGGKWGGEKEGNFVQQNMSRTNGVKWSESHKKPYGYLMLVKEGGGGQNGGTLIIGNVKCHPLMGKRQHFPI